MEFRKIATFQSYFGIVSAVLLMLFARLIVKSADISNVLNHTALTIFYLFACFIILVCTMLFILRDIDDLKIKKKIILANMLTDFIVGLILVLAAIFNKLTLYVGIGFGIIMIINALTYLPCYRKLSRL